MKKTRAVFHTIGVVLVLLVGYGGTLAALILAAPRGESVGYYLLQVLLFLAAYMVSKFVFAFFHELGHFVFGEANGFRLAELTVGPVRMTKNGKRIRLGWRRHSYAGMILMANTKRDHLYRRYFLLTLGGVLFSCLCAAGSATALVLTFGGIPYPAYCVLAACVPSSWHLVAFNAFVFREDGICSDGAVLDGIRRKEEDVRLNVVLLSIQGMLCAGQSPAEIGREAFYLVPETGSVVNRIQLTDYRYIYALDTGNTEEAIALSDEMAKEFSELPEVYRPAILTDIFYTELVFKNNLDRAKRLYEEIEPYLLHDRNICNLRIRAAYELYLRKNPRKAIATAKDALSIRDEFLLPGVAKMEERILQELMKTAARQAEAEEKKPLSDDLPEYRG